MPLSTWQDPPGFCAAFIKHRVETVDLFDLDYSKNPDNGRDQGDNGKSGQ
jgi:hypothetical protein